MSAQGLIQLRSNPDLWAELVVSGQISASGVACDLSLVFSKLSQQYPVAEP